MALKHHIFDPATAPGTDAPLGIDESGTPFDITGLPAFPLLPQMLIAITEARAAELTSMQQMQRPWIRPASPDIAGQAPVALPMAVATDQSDPATTMHASAIPAATTQQTSIATSSIALGANVATALYGVTGAGLKIGVISDSFNADNGAATDMANAILPNVTVLSDATTGSDEGRAMIELAYSIAPGASYYTAEGSSLAAEVTALQNAGVNIIVDDLSVGGEALYQVGSATDVAIESAVAGGVDYFTSAGNNGNDYYEQGFTPLAVTIAGIGTVTANNFGANSPYLSLTLPANFKSSIVFQFAQPFGSFGAGANSPTNSLAIYLLDASGNVVASSTVNDVGGDPTQGIDFNNTTANTAYRLVVVQNGGTVPSGQLFKFFLNDANGTINSPNAGKGSGDLLGHELLTNINVVGSVPYTATPAYGTSPSVIDAASSVGPGTVLFDPQGNPIAPVTQGVPQFESVDGTLTGTANTGFATSPFFGTSAAAPTAAAVSALVLQADLTLSTAQVTSVLAQSIIPVTVNSPSSGAGLIQARAAVEIAAADAGNRWTTAAGGNWNNAASWSNGATPTATQAVGLDDNLGAFASSYTITVNTSGDVAGSLAISAPAGSASTLTVASGTLAVGPQPMAILAASTSATTTDITSGDLLVSDNGTLNVTGGALSVSGSLNLNNGAITVSLGSATAANYAQNSGLLTVGGGGGATGLSLTGSGFAESGGIATVAAQGTLATTSFTDSDATFSTALGGAFTDSGTAGFTASAILNNAGSFTETGAASFANASIVDSGVFNDAAAASFLGSTITDSGSFVFGSASISESTFAETGSLVTTGALNFDDTPATIAKGATINAASLGVGSTLTGYTPVLTIAGKVSDAGALGQGASNIAGSVVLQTGGELDVGGANTTVGVTFAGNGLLDYTSSSTAVLANQLTATISGLASGIGAIDLTGLTYNAADSLGYDAGSGQLNVFDQNGNSLAAFFLNTTTNYTNQLRVMSDGATNHVEVVYACFLEGVMIATPAGEIAVEDLVEGEMVSTRSAARTVAKPITWVGRRSVVVGPEAADEHYPVRFRAGAVADGVPSRDLLVTSDHCLHVDGRLIPARMLVNGASIIVDRSISSFTYYHVELAQHAILIADGMETESYLDTGNRAHFSDAAVMAIAPDVSTDRSPRSWAEHAAAPLAVDRQMVEPIWAALLQRAIAQGVERAAAQALTDQPELRLLLDDGRSLAADREDAACATFRIPAHARAVRLLSRASSPSQAIGPFIDDRRRLGVAVSRLMVRDGLNAIEMPASEMALPGWYGAERDCRWMNGNAALDLPVASADTVLDVHIEATTTYVLELPGAA